MNVAMLHVLNSLNPAEGGPTEGQRQICSCYANSGIRAEAITLDPPDAPWLDRWPVPVHALGGRGKYGWTPRLPQWLRENRHRFSCVFAHGLWQWQGAGTRQGLAGTDTPYYLFPHGMLDPWFRTAWPLKHLRKMLYWRLFENRVVRDAAAVIFTAEEERLLGRETFSPWLAKKELIIPLGTLGPPQNREDARAKFLARFPELRGKRLLIFLSRIHEKKGCDLLLEALRRVAPPLHLVLAGPCGDEQLLQQLQAQANGLPVTFTGPLWDDEKWGAIAAAEAFILPSHQENFGIAVVEALACGVPVLISNKINIWREVVGDGAGFAEDDTVEGTVKLLTRWLAADQPAMRAAAERSAQARFDIRQTAAALAKLAASSSA